MKFEYRHVFDVNVDTLIKSVFDPDLGPHLTEKMTTIVSIETLERTEDEVGVAGGALAELGAPRTKQVGRALA